MPDETVITVTLDRTEEVYARGDRIEFNVQLTQDGEAVEQGRVHYELRKNLVEDMSDGWLELSSEGATVHASLDEPGFVACTVTFTPSDGEPVTAAIAAGVAPWEIKPSMPVPEDFDAFWQAQLARLAEIPLSCEQELFEFPNDEIVCWDTQIPCVDGVPVSGFYARPRDASPKSLPAILALHGAGVTEAWGENAIIRAQRGWLSMDINAHGIPNGHPREFYTDLVAGELADYRHRGRGNREEQYFVGMFLRVRRALDFLCAQPEWDGRVLVTHGHSQGGYQAIAGAALDPRVTLFSAGVPAGCDHTGYKVGRPNGWPRISHVPDEGHCEEFAEAARYIDAVNFAQRTKAEAIFSVGGLDGSCDPTGVYAAYNSHPGPKRMIHRAAMGHGSPPDINGSMTRDEMAHARRLSV